MKFLPVAPLTWRRGHLSAADAGTACQYSGGKFYGDFDADGLGKDESAAVRFARAHDLIGRGRDSGFAAAEGIDMTRTYPGLHGHRNRNGGRLVSNGRAAASIRISREGLVVTLWHKDAPPLFFIAAAHRISAAHGFVRPRTRRLFTAVSLHPMLSLVAPCRSRPLHFKRRYARIRFGQHSFGQ